VPQHDLVARLLLAWESNDEIALASLLQREVRLVVDSGDETGGELHGRVRVIRALGAQLTRFPDVSLLVVHVNGRPGVALRRPCGEVVGVLGLDGSSPIDTLWLSTSPQKLAHWNRRRPELE
jgi:hypothetical protein